MLIGPLDPTAPGTAELLSGASPPPQEAAPGLCVLPRGPSLSGHNIQALDPEDLTDVVAPLAYDTLVFPPWGRSSEAAMKGKIG